MFAIEIHDNKSNQTVKWFAASDADRKDWAFLLRKHAIHHDISNGFKVSSTVSRGVAILEETGTHCFRIF